MSHPKLQKHTVLLTYSPSWYLWFGHCDILYIFYAKTQIHRRRKTRNRWKRKMYMCNTVCEYMYCWWPLSPPTIKADHNGFRHFEHKESDHSAFHLVLFLPKIDVRPCQMTHQQIIRVSLLWHRTKFARGRRKMSISSDSSALLWGPHTHATKSTFQRTKKNKHQMFAHGTNSIFVSVKQRDFKFCWIAACFVPLNSTQ